MAFRQSYFCWLNFGVPGIKSKTSLTYALYSCISDHHILKVDLMWPELVGQLSCKQLTQAWFSSSHMVFQAPLAVVLEHRARRNYPEYHLCASPPEKQNKTKHDNNNKKLTRFSCLCTFLLHFSHMFEHLLTARAPQWILPASLHLGHTLSCFLLLPNFPDLEVIGFSDSNLQPCEVPLPKLCRTSVVLAAVQDWAMALLVDETAPASLPAVLPLLPPPTQYLGAWRAPSSPLVIQRSFVLRGCSRSGITVIIIPWAQPSNGGRQDKDGIQVLAGREKSGGD